MKKSRVLFLMQEVMPYVKESYLSNIGRNLPQKIQETGKEIRTFMPRYGIINERRNQLHEVIRLSGMNLIINDTDHPLIIKVASIQAARMQVYFIDNEDYFHRKGMVGDNENAFFSDNDERAMFFAKGVIETVKKLSWAPDLIHCNGWFTALAPLYIKTLYKDNPLFDNKKVVYTVYSDGFENPLNKNLKNKLLDDGCPDENMHHLDNPTFVNLNKFAIDYADAVTLGDDNIDQEILDYIEERGITVLPYQENDDYASPYTEFYDTVLAEEEEVMAE